uniref:FLYWCH-type domain-containing protein n=1 Tax=Strongyloides venezuelensis TaxID=75913 RepID=A0A0K0FSM9_STRVS
MVTIGLAKENLLTAQVYLVVEDNVLMQQIYNKPQYWGCRGKNVACRICEIVPYDYKKALTSAKVDQKNLPSNNHIAGHKHEYIEPMHNYINGVVSYVSYTRFTIPDSINLK